MDAILSGTACLMCEEAGAAAWAIAILVAALDYASAKVV